MRLARWSLVSLLSVSVALPARRALPQRITSTLDLGGARIRYADTLDASVLSVSPSVRAGWSRATINALGSYSRFVDGGWSADGDLDVSLFTPSLGVVVGELAASGGGSAQGDGTRTGRLVSELRVHAMGGSTGAWVGGGLGRSYDGIEWRPTRLLDIGAWGQAAGFTVIGSVEPSVVADTIRYTDTNVGVRWEARRVDIGASAGLRSGERLPALGGTQRSWGSVSIAVRATNRIAVVIAGGTYPVDLTQGFPGGRFASLAIRVGAGDWTRPTGTQLASEREGAEATGVAAFAVDRVDDERHTIRVRAPAAQVVELSGDFTAWKPVSLSASGDGWWATTLVIADGTHQLNVRIDGGAWVVPPGLTRLTEEFGGTTGLLVIGRP